MRTTKFVRLTEREEGNDDMADAAVYALHGAFARQEAEAAERDRAPGAMSNARLARELRKLRGEPEFGR